MSAPDRYRAAVELERAAQNLRDLGDRATEADRNHVRDARAAYDQVSRGGRR